MSDTQDADPKDVLIDIAQRLERVETKLDSQVTPRIDLSSATSARVCLQYLRENGASTTTEIRKSEGISDASRPLSKLYQAYYVDRRDNVVPYRYELTDLGRRALDEHQDKKQSEITDAVEDGGQKKETGPWLATNLNRSQWYALVAVDEYDGRPKAGDVNNRYLELTEGNEHAEGPAISARLTELVREGYLGRPPDRPYLYWVTEEGQSLLDENTG